MQSYSELVPPSGVTQSIALSFTSSRANNLVVARTSLLQIFEVKSSDQSTDSRLALVAEYRLSGTVTNLGRVALEKLQSGGDALLVSFRDAKLSLLEWNPSQHNISTISIHYYENHALQAAPWLPDLKYTVSHLTIDPNSRCAAFNFGTSSLAVIPFHQHGDDLAMDDELDDLDDGDKAPIKNGHNVDGPTTPYSASFVLPLTAIDPALLHPVDLSFLHEYRDPTIGILYSTAARSNNMSAERKDVTMYSVYALDIEQRASTTLQSVTNLPNDIHSVVALPLPVSGSLLIGGNEIIHIDQGGKATGIAVNEFAREASAFPVTDHSDYRMRLEGCKVAHLASSTGEVLLILDNGDLVVCSFKLDGRSVSGIALRRVESDELRNAITGSMTCTATFSSGQVFIGSEESDSVLIGPKRSNQLKRQTSKGQPLNGHSVGNADAGEDDAMDDDDDLFADDSAENNEHAAPGNSLAVLDTLQCVGPLRDVAFGRATKRKRGDDDADQDHFNNLELAASYGRGHSGGIAFLSQRLRPTINRRIKHGHAQSIWSCRAVKRTEQKFIVSERTEDDTVMSSLWDLRHNKLRKMGETEFEPTIGQPIAVGSFCVNDRTIYVTGGEIRVYDACKHFCPTRET
jgi:cleavage and polyadenylation specificity factor subunit 1